MKKNQISMHNLGEQLELEEFMNNNSTHEFSKDYINKKNNLLNSIGYNEKVKKVRKRNFVIAAASGFAVIALPASVFAAKQIMSGYGITTKQTNNYEYQLSFSNPTDDNGNELDNSDVNYAAEGTSSAHYDPELYHTFVQMNIGYMMNGYTLSNNSSSTSNGLFKYHLDDDYTNSHNITISLVVINENQVITKNNAIEVKNIVVGDNNEATIFYKNALDETSYNKNMIIYFKEYGYAVEIFAQVNVSEDDLMDIANNISITPCDEDVAMSGTVYYERTDSADTTTTHTSEDSVTKTLTNDENIVDIGQPFSFETFKGYNDNALEYTVESYKTMDSVSEFDEAGFGFHLDTIKRLTNEDGKLSYQQQTIERGDGSNTLSKVTDTSTINAKFVYVTMKVKNTSDTDISEVKIEPQICCLNDDNTIPSRSYYASQKGSIEGYSLYCDYPTMYAQDPDTYSSRNYYGQRYTIPAGEEIEYHVGFVVDADKMDNMVLFFNAFGTLGESGNKKAKAVIKLNKF